MKSIKRVSQENPKSTVVTVLAAIIFVATLFLDQAEIIGLDMEIVKWVSFGVSMLTGIVTYIKSHLNNEA